MANEVEIQAGVRVLNASGEELVNWQSGVLSFSQVGDQILQGVVDVTTGAVVLGVPTGTLGLMLLKSEDTATTSVIDLLSTLAGITVARLKAGEISIIKLGAGVSAPSVKMSTGTGVLRWAILQL